MSRRCRQHRPRATFPLAALAFALPIARASAQDVAAAETLFREGKAMMKAGDYAKACPRLLESERLDRSAGTALNLAACHGKEGKTATAWAEYLIAARVAREQNKAAIAEEASARAKELEPNLSYLVIRIPQHVPSIEVSRDGTELDAALLDTKLPVDPGVHQIRVSARGYLMYEATVTVGGPHDEKWVTVPELAPDPESKRTSEPTPTTAPPASALANLPSTRGVTPSHGFAYSVGAIGVLGVAAGTALGAAALVKHSQAQSLCPSDSCANKEGVDAQNLSRTLGWAADVGFAVGVVGVGAAAYLLLTSRSDAASGSAVHVVPVGSAGGAGLAAVGQW